MSNILCHFHLKTWKHVSIPTDLSAALPHFVLAVQLSDTTRRDKNSFNLLSHVNLNLLEVLRDSEYDEKPRASWDQL